MLFYLGEHVAHIQRSFEYGGVMMAEAIVNNDKIIVEYSQLTEKPTESKAPEPVKAVIKEETVVEVKESKPAPESESKEVKPSKDKVIKVVKLPNDKLVGMFNKGTMFDSFMRKNKLSPEAVELVLEGKQKTHKGYKFSYN